MWVIIHARGVWVHVLKYLPLLGERIRPPDAQQYTTERDNREKETREIGSGQGCLKDASGKG
jgi:hypothetical protein